MVSGKTSTATIARASVMARTPTPTPATMGPAQVLLTCGDIVNSGPTASERSGVRWLAPPDEPAVAKPRALFDDDEEAEVDKLIAEVKIQHNDSYTLRCLLTKLK